MPQLRPSTPGETLSNAADVLSSVLRTFRVPQGLKHAFTSWLPARQRWRLRGDEGLSCDVAALDRDESDDCGDERPGDEGGDRCGLADVVDGAGQDVGEVGGHP